MALTLLLLVTMLPITGQIPTVAAAPSQTGTVSTNVDSSFHSSVTFSHITPSGDNRLLVVTVGIRGTQSVSAVTYGGNNLTLATANGSGTTGGQRVEIWYLVAPDVGSADVVVTYTAGLNQSGVAAISYDGINQLSPIGATAGAVGLSTNPTVSISTNFTDTLIVGGVSARGGDTYPFTPGSGTTELFDMASGTNKSNDDGYTGGEESTPTASAYTFDFTAAVSDDWAIAVVELRALSTATVTTQAATSVNTTGATLNGNITDVGSSNVTKRGFQYGLTTSYGDNFTETGNYGTGSFSTVIGSLDPGTTYHYRAIAFNTAGWAYGGDQSFVTTTTTPTVVTNAADGISPSGATLNGNVSTTGGASIDERGFDYGLTAGYGSEDTETGSFGTGTFNAAITGLSPDTLYHFRAKAHNTNGWSYGDDTTFTTNAAGAATVVTNAATTVNSTGATLNGDLTSTGGENADIRGFDYGATESYGSNTTESGDFGTGTFSAVIGSLAPGVTYHFRAKVHNSNGWAYGSDTTFTTSVVLSTVSTSAATGVAASEATLNGNITNTGGENADIRGFQYGLTAGYGTNSTESGSYGTGTFGLPVSSLTPDTLYHFRAMAHNSAGWSYGDDLTFTTDPLLAPTVTTSTATAVSVYGATLNGNITATGGENADFRGFQYGLTTGYGTNSTESGSFGTGAFDAELSGLDADTTYHFRAMAHNSQGWNYGTDQTFTTNVPGVAPVYTARTLDYSSGVRTTANFTHNTPAGDNRLLLVTLGLRGDVSASAVTYNGSNLTLAKAHGSGTATGQRVEIWYLVGPPEGSYDLVVYYSDAGPVDADGIAAMSYEEVDQNTPIGDTAGADSETGTNPTVQVAVGSDDALIVGGVSLRGGDNGPFTPGSGTTERYDFASGSHAISDDVYAGGDEDAATSGTYTFDFTGTGSDDWAIAAVELRPISSASVTTQAATSVNSSGATLNANITDIGSSSVTVRGFEYGLTAAYGSNTTQSGTYGTGTYNLAVSSLSPGTTYHFRAYVYNNEGWAYGSDLTLATSAAAPTVTTEAAGGLGPNGATLNGEITATGGASIDIRGFDYGLTAGYGSSATESGSFGTGTFQQTLTGLAPSTLYHFRAKAHNGAGWAYGSDLTFTTNAAGAATVTTQSATSVNSANATLNANDTNTGGINLDARGFDYGLTDSYGSSVTANGSFGTGTYSEIIVGLSPGTEIHYRAKVHNTAGWSYGTDLHFTTDVVLPTVATQAASSIEATLATLNGSVSDTGGENVDIRGFDYGLTAGYGSSWTENGSFNTGAYSVGLSSLTPDTTYHFRAKAHNSAGWTYGTDFEFTTDPLVAPTVTTSAASAVSVYGATLNGNLTDVGGENADIRGFQYGLTTGYGTNASASGSFGTGTFYEELTGLSSGTTYHFRAMAHNSVGWSYGSDLTLTTSVPGVAPVFAGRTLDSSNTDHTSTIFSHSTPAGSNRALLVIVGIRGDESVTSLTYSGVSLTQAVANGAGDADGQRVEIWYLANPPTGSHNVVVNFATSTNPDGIVAMSYNGADQLNPIGGTAGNNDNTGTNPSAEINVYSDDALIVGGVSMRGGDTIPFTPGTGTTERYDFASGGSGSTDDGYAGGDEDAPTTGVYTFDFTGSVSDDWAIAAVELRPVSNPSVTTQAATSVNSTAATLNGNITDLGSANVTERGFQYGLTAGYGSNTTESGNYSTGTYGLVISSLNPNTTYHFRAIAYNDQGWAYGEDDTFTTSVAAPTVASSAASGLGPNGATINGNITAGGGENADIRGFDYGLTAGYGSTATESGDFGTGTFQQTLGGLSANTTYHFRAKAHNSAGWGYGSDLTFTTNAAGAATVITQAATSINATGATLNGNLTNTGGINADIRGFQYGLTTGYGTNATESGSFGTGTFNATIGSLNPGVTYHFRAMSHNTAGWSYGTDLTFSIPVQLATVLTSAASAVSQLEATLNGNITDLGGENVDIRGFDYGLTAGYGSSVSESGDYGISGFSLVVSSLSSNTTYHFRAKAHNSAGWGYGTDFTFTTTALAVPTLTTSAASSVGVLSATLNGAITDTGGDNADARGFEYGLTTGYGSSVSSNGSFGIEAFYEVASGLADNTTYHFRAMAHNSQGWGYGNDLTFTTGIPGAEPIHTATTTDSSNTDRSSANFTHSTPTGTDLGLLVIVNIHGDETVSSLSYGGDSLTLAVAQGSGASSGQRVEIWYLIAPSTGANDIVVTYSGTVNPDSVIALSYENVNQTSPIGTTAGQNFSSGTNPSLNISTTVVDALIVGGASYRGGDADPFTPGTGVTERYDFATGTSAIDDDSFTGGEKSAAAISSYTFDFTASNSNYWTIAAVELKPPTPPANISNSPDTYDFGIVQMSATPSTGLMQFTLNNSSVYAINVSISAGDMVGDSNWILSNTATPGADTFGLKAGLEGGSYSVIVKKTVPYNVLVSNMPVSSTQKWGIQFVSPTSTSDGSTKSTSISLTVTVA